MGGSSTIMETKTKRGNDLIVTDISYAKCTKCMNYDIPIMQLILTVGGVRIELINTEKICIEIVNHNGNQQIINKKDGKRSV